MNKKIFYLVFCSFCFGFNLNDTLNDLNNKAKEIQNNIKIGDNQTSLSMPTNKQDNKQDQGKDDLFLNNKQTKIEEYAPNKKIQKQYKVPQDAVIFEMKSYLEIPIVVDRYAIIDFPFAINVNRRTSFETRDPGKNNGRINKQELQNIFSFQKQENKLILKSQITGSIDFLILGGDYPIVLKVFVNKNKGESYYAIRNKQKNLEKDISSVKKFEARTHEDVIASLIYGIKNGIAKDGYTHRKNIDNIFKLKKEKITLILREKLIGNQYVVEKWSVINDNKKPIQLYEEMFFENNEKTPIYAISLDNDVIEKNRSTELLIVRGR
ncbi:hypothetical protein CQA57_07110 [Helicobacter anseris]|uniref:TraK C-terminal domain-containing protein n=1 Tax=Helicobacter anseris TaxID=375926 RepID=A0A3D8J5E3_9HELI|nr:type-F conjugative transfer system secretin TraK [Helicobacter anseris]RDU72365.1 hypothetical protein CQA57_07110 [Helicobacter anseris]